jgi:hypothetical protein
MSYASLALVGTNDKDRHAGESDPESDREQVVKDLFKRIAERINVMRSSEFIARRFVELNKRNPYSLDKKWVDILSRNFEVGYMGALSDLLSWMASEPEVEST